jgi:hypothetical protein
MTHCYASLTDDEASSLKILFVALLITRNHLQIKLRILIRTKFFPLSLEPSSGLGRLHETSRFTSVTPFRTVGRTWTGDQLVARPLLVHKHIH